MSTPDPATSFNVRTFGVPAANEFTKITPFSILVFTILIVWVLIDLLTRFVFNLSHNTFGLSSTSTLHSLLVFLFVLIFFIATVWVIDTYELVEGGLTGSVVGIGGPIIDVSTMNNPSNGSNPGPTEVPTIDSRNGSFISEE